MNREQSALEAEGGPGRYRPASPTPLLHRVAAKQHCQNFAKHKILTKLFWIFWHSRKILWNTKLKILRTFYEITKTNILAATLLLHNLPSATHPPLPSAKTFFIAARQCYFEMKTIKQPYFSILSSLSLWLGHTYSQQRNLDKNSQTVSKSKTICVFYTVSFLLVGGILRIMLLGKLAEVPATSF